MTRPLPPSKLSRVTAAMAAGDYVTALRIAAKFGELGDAKERITRAWAAHTNPDFYAQLGQNPDALFADGVAAIRERYNLPCPTPNASSADSGESR